MRSRTLAAVVFAVGTACLMARGAAFAQSRGTAASSVAPTKSSPLTPKEELEQGQAVVDRVSGARSTVRRQLEQARAQRDVVKTLCLSDKLSQLDVAARSAEERKSALASASSRGDRDLARHELTILAVLRQRTEQLVSDSNQCIGKEAGMVGESAVSSSVDPNLPQEEAPSVSPPGLPMVVVQPPACASCFE